MPWWREGLIIPWDANNQFYPTLRWLAAELDAGRLPDFIAEIYAGRPALHDPQSMITSPGFLIVAALDPTPSMTAMNMMVLAELLLGGLALMWLGRLRGIHPVACLFAAMVFMLGGAPLARSQHILLVQSYAFLPFVLLAVDAFARRPTIRRGVLAGAAAGFLAVGRDHVAFLGLYLVAGWALFVWLSRPAPLRWLREAALPVVLAGLVAAAVALPPVLATVAFGAESNRPAFPLWISGGSEICPACLLTFPFANIFDGLRSTGSYWGPGNRNFLWPIGADATTIQLYAGIAPLVLAVWFLPALRRAGSLQRFATVALAVALLYAVGKQTPVFGLIHAVVPGVDLFRRASDGAYLVNLCFALFVLAAAARYVESGLPPAARWRTLLLVAFAVAVPAAALWVASVHGRLVEAWDDVAIGVAGAAAAVGILLWGARGGLRRRVVAMSLLAAGAAVDLSVNSAGTKLNALPVGQWAVQADPMADPVAPTLVQRVEEAEAGFGPVRVETLGLRGPWQNLPLALGVESISGSNPLRTARFDRAMGANQNSHLDKRRFGEQFTGYASDMADLLGVRFLLLGAPIEEIDAASAPAFGPPEMVGSRFLYTNHDALPRALLVRADRTRPMDPDLAEGGGPLPDLDWETEALVGIGADGAGAPAAGDGPAGSLTIVEHAPGRLVAEIDPEAEGYVVHHELRMDGWVARVDGERRALMPANGLFQAVPVRPGDRRVEFVYSPLAAFGIGR